MASCIVDTPDAVRALGVVDALHVILGFHDNDDASPAAVALGDDYFLRPYALVEMVKTGKGKKDIPNPFSSSPLLMFTAYKTRTPHHIAALVLRKMGIKDEISFMDSTQDTVVRRKWRGKPAVKTQLFKYAYDGRCDGDDGYLKALQATLSEGEVPPDWEVRLLLLFF